MQLVRNYDDSLAVVPHSAKHRKELLGLLRGKHRGRLVKYKYIRASVKHLDYLDRLLLGNRHFVYFFIRVYLKAVLLAYLLDFSGRTADIIVLLFLKTQNDIFRRAENIDQLEMLMNHSDTVAERVTRGAYYNLFTVYKYLSVVRKVNTSYHIHKRGFSAAVLTQNRQYLAAVHRQVDIAVGYNAAEGFCYIFQFNSRTVAHASSPSVCQIRKNKLPNNTAVHFYGFEIS